jgi:hypothetical protein
MSSTARGGWRSTARAGSLLLLAAALTIVGPAFGAASGTLAFSLDPDSTVLGPGDRVTVTVKNTEAKKSTSALVASLTNPAEFQMIDGCSGTALGPGKTCQVTIVSTLASTPSTDRTATLTVMGKKAGTTSPRTVTVVVPGSACVVTNGSMSYTSAQAAVDAADDNDVLDVRGRCIGNVTIDKDLTIRGEAGAGAPTLDANLVGVTMRIGAAASVTLHDLVVTGGTGAGGAAIGGGIENDGVLTLTGTTSVSGNQPAVGFGISNSGVLIMNDSSSVSGNIAEAGGGVGNEGTFVMNDSSSVSGNTAVNGGGIVNSGTLSLNGLSSVSDNSAVERGGGIVNSGVLTMNEASSVWGNTAGTGGGIRVEAGGVLNGAVAGVNVFDNTPEDISQG